MHYLTVLLAENRRYHKASHLLWILILPRDDTGMKNRLCPCSFCMSVHTISHVVVCVCDACFHPPSGWARWLPEYQASLRSFSWSRLWRGNMSTTTPADPSFCPEKTLSFTHMSSKQHFKTKVTWEHGWRIDTFATKQWLNHVYMHSYIHTYAICYIGHTLKLMQSKAIS